MTSQIVNKTKFLQKNHLALENWKNTLTYQNLTLPRKNPLALENRKNTLTYQNLTLPRGQKIT